MRLPVRTAMKAGIIAVVLGAAISGCAGPGAGTSATESSTVQAGGTLTIGAIVDNNSFDVAEIQVGNRLQYWTPVYDTLLTTNPKLEVLPGLATKWEYNDSRTELTLALRDDVSFSDGSKFTADTVKANLERLKAGTGSERSQVKAVSSVEVLKADEVKLVLSNPDPDLLSSLSQVAGAQASPASFGLSTVKTVPVGSGPYVLDTAKTSQGVQYTYTKRPDYWKPEAQRYDTIVIKPITDVTARLNALKSGQVNAALLDARSAADAKGNGLNVHNLPNDFTGLIIADREGKIAPALADVRVRQAINYAIDGDTILKSIYLGQGTSTTQIFNKNSLAYDESLNSKYPFDPAKAKDLMKEAGYEKGFAITFPEMVQAQSVNPIIQQQLGEIGITVNFEKISPEQNITAAQSGKYPMFWFPLGSQGAWSDIQKYVAPTAVWNSFKVSDPELDRLIKEANSAPQDKQSEAFRKVNTWLVDNAWFAPWLFSDQVYVTDTKTSVQQQPQLPVPPISNFGLPD